MGTRIKKNMGSNDSYAVCYSLKNPMKNNINPAINIDWEKRAFLRIFKYTFLFRLLFKVKWNVQHVFCKSGLAIYLSAKFKYEMRPFPPF